MQAGTCWITPSAVPYGSSIAACSVLAASWMPPCAWRAVSLIPPSRRCAARSASAAAPARDMMQCHS